MRLVILLLCYVCILPAQIQYDLVLKGGGLIDPAAVQSAPP